MEQQNIEGKTGYTNKKIKNMLSGYYVISMISLIRSILSVILGFILLFVVSIDNIDELPESFRIVFYIIYLLTVGL